MKLQLFIVSLILLIIFLTIYWINRKNGLYIKSNIDEHYYYVSDLPNKQEIADLLAKTKLNIKKLLNYLNAHQNPKYKDYVDRLNDKINSVSIIENTSKNLYTSYSVNKGEELVICVRSRKTGELHNINLIMYVVLHEIAHIMCPEYGHGELFQKIFKYITKSATECGLYHPIDFKNNPTEYCGLTINSNIID
jgi:predicted metal-dependent hydrolase